MKDATKKWLASLEQSELVEVVLELAKLQLPEEQGTSTVGDELDCICERSS